MHLQILYWNMLRKLFKWAQKQKTVTNSFKKTCKDDIIVMPWRQDILQFKSKQNTLPSNSLLQQISHNTLYALNLAQNWLLSNLKISHNTLHALNLAQNWLLSNLKSIFNYLNIRCVKILEQNNIKFYLDFIKPYCNWFSNLLTKERKYWLTEAKEWKRLSYSLNNERSKSFQPFDLFIEILTQLQSIILELQQNWYILLSQNRLFGNKQSTYWPSFQQTQFFSKLNFIKQNWPINTNNCQEWQINYQHDYQHKTR